MPRVSVIVPVHNGAAFLRAALDSALAQTMRDLELVVADDGSQDDSAAIAETYGPPLRLLRVRHGNTQATRNAAIAAGDSEFVALLDQDDAWWPVKLERQLARFAQDPALGLCYTDTRGIDARGQELREGHNPLVIPQDWTEGLGRLLRVNLMAASSVLLRRSALERVGPFDPAFHLAGDWDLWLRVAEAFPITGVPEVLLDYRVHGANASRGQLRMLREGVAVQEAALTRIARHPRWSGDRGLAPYLRAARRKLAARYSELGVLYGREGQRAQALAWHGRALRLGPWEPRAWSRWARALLGARHPSTHGTPRP